MSDRARLRAFAALCLARLREVYREPEVVFWSFVFPILLSVGLGLAFRNRPPESSPVGVVEGGGAAAVVAALERASLLKVRTLAEAEAGQALRLGRVDVVVVPGAAPSATTVEYRLDPSRPEAILARSRVDDALQRAAGRQDPLTSREVAVSEPGGRYIDFLIPGIIGMNLMSGGMWGMGFNLVDMRIKRLLKRLLATPLRRADFLGSHLAVLLVATLGALCFSGLGLLVASRATRIETVTGLMNVVMMPMFICSGIFFSADRFPDALQPLIRALPLTALNDGLRAVILEGASLASQSGRLLVLGLWGGLSFAVGLKLFRWN